MSTMPRASVTVGSTTDLLLGRQCDARIGHGGRCRVTITMERAWPRPRRRAVSCCEQAAAFSRLPPLCGMATRQRAFERITDHEDLAMCDVILL